jgi:hypothetical protein
MYEFGYPKVLENEHRKSELLKSPVPGVRVPLPLRRGRKRIGIYTRYSRCSEFPYVVSFGDGEEGPFDWYQLEVIEGPGHVPPHRMRRLADRVRSVCRPET